VSLYGVWGQTFIFFLTPIGMVRYKIISHFCWGVLCRSCPIPSKVMARPLRHQFEGALYHLVVRGNARKRLFRDDRDRRCYLELLHRYRNQFGLRIYAYVLMNCRVHLLVETPQGNVSKLMQCLGTSYASYFNRRYKRNGGLFDGRYRSYLLLDKEVFLPEATRYIHRAPHGSVLNRNRSYRWSSYRVYLGSNGSNLVDTGPVLSRLGEGIGAQQKRYREFAEENRAGKNYRAMVRSQISTGFPPGHLDHQQSTSLKKAHEILRNVRLSLESKDVPGPRMRKKRALAHHVAMYLIRRQTSLSLNAIGGLLGVKAPAVALAIGKLEKLLRVGELPRVVRSLLQADFTSFPDKRGVRALN